MKEILWDAAESAVNVAGEAFVPAVGALAGAAVTGGTSAVATAVGTALAGGIIGLIKSAAQRGRLAAQKGEQAKHSDLVAAALDEFLQSHGVEGRKAFARLPVLSKTHFREIYQTILKEKKEGKRKTDFPPEQPGKVTEEKEKLYDEEQYKRDTYGPREMPVLHDRPMTRKHAEMEESQLSLGVKPEDLSSTQRQARSRRRILESMGYVEDPNGDVVPRSQLEDERRTGLIMGPKEEADRRMTTPRRRRPQGGDDDDDDERASGFWRFTPEFVQSIAGYDTSWDRFLE
jgi:cytochrome c553